MWFDPATAARVGYSQASTTNNSLTLPLPGFQVDLAAVLYPPPTLSPLGLSPARGFQFQLVSETGGQYLIQKSADLGTWDSFLLVTNLQGTSILADPGTATSPDAFFRAKQNR